MIDVERIALHVVLGGEVIEGTDDAIDLRESPGGGRQSRRLREE